MLLIDGVKYEVWVPPSEDEFERIVKEHARDIFGEQSEYFGKQKLESKLGIGSVPDGFVIMFGESPCWHIVEVELSSHDLHRHIVEQASRFIIGIKNPQTQRKIVDAIYEEIKKDDFLERKVRKASGTADIYKLLTDLISKPPVLTIIIEKRTEELNEALGALAHPQIQVVEFQTFTREGVGLSVHAHLFEPLYKPSTLGRERGVAPPRGLELEHILPQREFKRGKMAYWKNAKTGEVKLASEVYNALPQELRKLDGTAKAGAWNTRVLPALHTKNIAIDWEPASE